MLTYKNVSYQAAKQQILTNINFELVSGSITAIIGPNGSGKSSIIELLAKKETEYQGMITLNKKQYQQERYQEIAVLKQTTKIPEHLTGYEFLEICLQAKNKLLHKNLTIEQKNVIMTKVNLCECQSIINKKVNVLSGGERQRLLICAALLKEPEILILDEPNTFLDIKYQHLVNQLLKRLNQEQGVTILVILHDINQAIQLSDSIILLKDGHVLTQKPAVNITTRDLSECFEINFTKHYQHFVAKV